MENKDQKPIELELLAPARDLKTGKAAVLAGADAVYIGPPAFGARAAAGNSWPEIEELVKFAHQYYVRVYLPVNTIFFNDEAPSVKETVWKAHEIGADAVIIQDMGILEMDLPPIPLFASTQTHNCEAAQVNFLQEAGFSRVILARELSLGQIKEIKSKTTVDLETFVHGALCASFSGRCYLSQAICGRSANRGRCVQACRLPYSLVDAAGKILIKDKYLLSLKDFNLIDHLSDLVQAGVTSFKIEGRLKDEIYVVNAAAKYRQTLDKIIAESNGRYKKQSSGTAEFEFEPDLEKTFNRGYTTYCFDRSPAADALAWRSQKSLGKFIGKVKNIGGDYFELDCKNDLKNGDGICWFDNNELAGTNINSVHYSRIYPAKWQKIKVGAEVYRNFDSNFEKKVFGGAHRRVAVDFCFKETPEGFFVAAADEDKNQAAKEFIFEKKATQNPEAGIIAWQKQFSRLGETIFFARRFAFNFKTPYFVPLSVLNDWRREITKILFEERIKNYPRVFIEHKKTNHRFPQPELDYSFNVANDLARNFYERHGARASEPAFELQNNHKGKKIMSCKHCLKYFIGSCPNYQRGRKIDFKEPLYLVGQKKKFRLNFDCENCIMEVWN